jgi:hypothetical protein
MRMMMMAARRTLLADDSHDDHDEHDDEEHHGEEEDTHESPTDIQIVAIFTILLAGLVGGCIPIFVPVSKIGPCPVGLSHGAHGALGSSKPRFKAKIGYG